MIGAQSVILLTGSYSMFTLSWILEKQLKIKSGFFLNRVNISANQMIIGNSKGVNNRHIRFGSITSLGKGCNGHCTYMASHRKCIVKILIGCKYYVKHLNKRFWNIFSGSSSTTNEPNFKIMCNCIHELLNVFEDSAQRERTIAHVVVCFQQWH